MKNLYLKRAEENLPKINEEVIVPQISPKELKKGDEIVIDLQNHYVGYFSFNLESTADYLDAPVRLYVKFCETKRELDDDFSNYKEGLCLSWLQEEIINIDFPEEYNMPRRYAARYIQIKVIAASRNFILSNFKFKSVTSADLKSLEKYSFKDSEFEKIDTVAVNTLKNCMQRVFEDGPKRDRRLWIGDLRLEALTGYYTFNNLELVRRCLYLFAAADTNDNGFLPGYIYETPKYISGSWFLEDYALLFVASACDYYNYTKDKECFLELYPVIKKQMDAAYNTLDSDGIASIAQNSDVFIDWCEGLNKITSLHGVYLYVQNMLAKVLNDICHDDAAVYQKRNEIAKKNAFEVLYDEENKKFVNKKDSCQYSVHSAVWMILGGVVDGNDAEKILTDVLNSEESIKPFTPYMHHYVIEAMLKLDMKNAAKEYIKNYWGGMIKLGADTFFEVYVPNDPDFSPYGDRMVNSMCHAWSCTGSYFIRKYFKQ